MAHEQGSWRGPTRGAEGRVHTLFAGFGLSRQLASDRTGGFAKRLS